MPDRARTAVTSVVTIATGGCPARIIPLSANSATRTSPTNINRSLPDACTDWSLADVSIGPIHSYASKYGPDSPPEDHQIGAHTGPCDVLEIHLNPPRPLE